MDSRHETNIQTLLNSLLLLVNRMITEHLDYILDNVTLHQDIEKMTKTIYSYAGTSVEVDAILTKHNLLSTDPIIFPLIDEIVMTDVMDVSREEHLLSILKSIILAAEIDNRHALFFYERAAELLEIV